MNIDNSKLRKVNFIINQDINHDSYNEMHSISDIKFDEDKIVISIDPMFDDGNTYILTIYFKTDEWINSNINKILNKWSNILFNKSLLDLIEDISKFDIGRYTEFSPKLQLVTTLFLLTRDITDNIRSIYYPEKFLHPSIQKYIGSFLVDISNLTEHNKLMIYTNSDHIINMMMYHINKGDINTSDVIIFHNTEEDTIEETYTRRIDGEYRALTPKKIFKIHEIEIMKDGFYDMTDRSIRFPKGFFDATLMETIHVHS